MYFVPSNYIHIGKNVDIDTDLVNEIEEQLLILKNEREKVHNMP